MLNVGDRGSCSVDWGLWWGVLKMRFMLDMGEKVVMMMGRWVRMGGREKLGMRERMGRM